MTHPPPAPEIATATATAPAASWPAAYGWAIDLVACPAYCCTPAGAVLRCNQPAERLWGHRPTATQDGLWDGFAALYSLDGAAIPKDASPSAMTAASGVAHAPVELLAEAANGQRRRLVVHARPILQPDGSVAGVFCSFTDISERYRLEEEARQADEHRGLFLTALAHELRNPLSPIMSVAATLRRISGEPNIVRMADIVERQTRQLARFITDLLDASRIERSHEVPVAMRDTTVGGVLELAHDAAAGAIAARSQTLHVNVANREAALWCDPERVAQALGNALLNASTFSADGSEISLDVSTHGALFEARVSDCGIGIDGAHLHEVFRPFRQFDRHRGHAHTGAGLGLAIARSVCKAHGGVVSAHSAGRGEGTRIQFALPIAVGAAVQ